MPRYLYGRGMTTPAPYTPPQAQSINFAEYVTVGTAAEVLDLTPTYIYRLVRTKKLGAVQTPLGLMISSADCQRERHQRRAAALVKAQSLENPILGGGQL